MVFTFFARTNISWNLNFSCSGISYNLIMVETGLMQQIPGKQTGRYVWFIIRTLNEESFNTEITRHGKQTES
jgi:hypothetical protein